MPPDDAHGILRSNYLRPVQRVGTASISVVQQIGDLLILLYQTARYAVTRPFRVTLLFNQMEFVGVGSLFIILLTGWFTGAVFTMQSMIALARVGMESMAGTSVMLAVTRELGPVLAALMVTGRVGSAFATELGTMRVTEQIDALEVMAVNPIQYLIAPRVIASTLMLPVLTVIFDGVAYFGSYFAAVVVQGIDEGAFQARIEWYLDPFDFEHGLIKATVFGLVIALLGCYKGFNASGGAKGVGLATTQAVVIGSISIFVIDYVLTNILLLVEPLQ